MKRRILLILFAALALLASHTNLYYRVSIDGHTLDGLYTRSQLDRCLNAAHETAVEILDTPVSMPRVKARPSPTLSCRTADEAKLTDALLQAVPGVKLCDGVIVNGTRLGTVADGEVLMQKLRAAIRSQMPNAAVFGNISGKVQIQKIYSRDSGDTPDEDMILLITGMAPVIYVDGNGKAV